MSLSDNIILGKNSGYGCESLNGEFDCIDVKDVKVFIKELKEAFNVNKKLYPTDIINELAGEKLI